MSNEEAIAALEMECALMQFDPMTGEDRPIEFQNKDNQDLYNANLVAIAAIKENDKLKAKIEKLNKIINKQWTPCRTGLPTSYDRYLVTDGCTVWDDIFETHYLSGKDRNQFQHDTGDYIAWQPLPPAWKKEEVQNETNRR